MSEIKNLLEDVADKIEKVEIYIDATKLDYDDEIFAIPKVFVKSIISDKELKKCQK